MAIRDNMVSFKVVVIGAGLGGLACAIACRRAGLDVEIFEKATKIEQVGAGIQVPPNAVRVLEEFGLMQQIRESAISLQAIELRRYKDGKLLTSRPVAGEESGLHPGLWLVIHRADYQKILLEEAEKLGARIITNACVTDIDFETSTVQFGAGEHKNTEADVIVGADGLWSSTRSKLLGSPSDPIATGDLAYRGTFSRAQLLSLNNPRVEELCNRDVMTVWLGPERHSVFYPIRGGSEFNLVLLRPDNLPEGSRTVKGDLEEMRETYEGWDEILSKIISCIPAVLKWKLYHHEELASWTKGCVALLGDACHPTLPYQAQGAAMAIEDGAVLGYLLGATVKRQRDGGAQSVERKDIKSVLGLYERLRKARTSVNVKGAIDNRNFYHLHDGKDQQERDRVLENFDWVHGKGRWSWVDSVYQDDLLNFNAVENARRAL